MVAKAALLTELQTDCKQHRLEMFALMFARFGHAWGGVQSPSRRVSSRPKLSPLELICHLSTVQSPRLNDFRTGALGAMNTDLMVRAHLTQNATPSHGSLAMAVAYLH